MSATGRLRLVRLGYTQIEPAGRPLWVAGCKALAVCGAKFGNVANFRGFPHIPGADVVTRYGVQGGLDATGGSLFG